VTTMIAGIALLAFGSGPVRGFAVVHVLGILTSMFSAVFVSRGIVALIYGNRKKLDRISVGQVWRPKSDSAATPGKQTKPEKLDVQPAASAKPKVDATASVTAKAPSGKSASVPAKS
ncbi:MAG TPA: protein translocase subunit SecD, partial [Casimicrobiaceae bacterium]|nr:protein translocase subunit SecD [Casimicrobiaceae bacterium]